MNALTLAGGLIELAGLALAAYGVRETRLAYGHDVPGISGRLRRMWISALVALHLRQRGTRHHSLGTALEVNFAARVSGYTSPGDGATAEQKLDFAVRLAVKLQKRMNELTTRLDAEQEARRKAEASLKASIAEAEATARKELATSHADGLWMEALGLLLAALGTALGLAGGL